MTDSLRFRSDGTFTIAVIEDVHWRNGEPDDQRSAALMSAILGAEQPDLVVVNGDLIHGMDCEDSAQSWRAAMQPILARGLPWAAVFGNHDDEGSLDRSSLMALQRTLPGCLSAAGPADVPGVGNYSLSILNADGDQTAAHLYLLDSHSYAKAAIGGYDWVKHEQVTWFRETAKRLRGQSGGELLPALAFCHIPLPEFNDVWDFHACRGVKGETICCPLINTGLFAAMHEAGDVMGLFCGHDHLNDYIGELHGISLAFGRATGYGGYGLETFARGARIVRLHAGERVFDTWLRLEGGQVVAEQPTHEPELTRRLCLPSDYE
jgi:hypothetical protein